jgi:hypothetical protein
VLLAIGNQEELHVAKEGTTNHSAANIKQLDGRNAHLISNDVSTFHSYPSNPDGKII